VTGAILNAGGIVLGGLVGLVRPQAFSAQTQITFKILLGVFALFFGLRLTWFSLGGSAGQMLKQVTIALAALVIGNWVGKLCRLQAGSNHLGQRARNLIENNRPDSPRRAGVGMNVCAILFCAAPLGLLGAIQDGLPLRAGDTGYFYPLAVKAVMDGLAMIGFVTIFGPGAILAALPVFVFLGTITTATHLFVEPFLRTHLLLDSVNSVGGLMVCCVGVVIFEIRRVELANYLPALLVAPLLTWLWR
jgi:hypothetical protein